MTTRRFTLALPGLLLVPLMVLRPGGWATITVEELPEYLVAGEQFDLTFTIRQHGRTPLNDLTPRVRAVAGRLQTTVTGKRGTAAGQYTAALTVPEPGEWTINIHSGFGKSEVTLIPITAVAPGTRAPMAAAAAERGRRLFVAKACVSCHVHAAVKHDTEAPVGPELTPRRYAADYLSQFLANPEKFRPAERQGMEMPNLNLDQAEIAALVTFINTETRVSGR